MDCSICLEVIKIFDCISVLPCGHEFHSVCYNDYRGHVCPMCRIPNMRKKVDTVKISDKYLFEWVGNDFASYINFVDEEKHLLEQIRKKLKMELRDIRRKKLNECIKQFYFKNLNQIRYNMLKNITEGNSCFPVLYCKFGDVYENYPIIFLLKGPREEQEEMKGVDFVLQLIQKDFALFSFEIKNNRGSMCYEVIAKRVDFRINHD